MEIFSTLLMLAGIFLFIFSVIKLILKVIKNAVKKKKNESSAEEKESFAKEKKSYVICIILSVVLLAAGIILTPTESEVQAPGGAGNGTAFTTELENFVGEYCMAYMDTLKNPYSFKVKYAWAHAIKSGANAGNYSVYIRFTAENNLGGTVTDVIASEVISSADLKNFMPQIHTWSSEPSYKTLGNGQELNVNAIQNYIDKNYK